MIADAVDLGVGDSGVRKGGGKSDDGKRCMRSFYCSWEPNEQNIDDPAQYHLEYEPTELVLYCINSKLF